MRPIQIHPFSALAGALVLGGTVFLMSMQFNPGMSMGPKLNRSREILDDITPVS